MAKEKIVWYCKNCGTEYSKWQGQCSGCKEWNTIVEAPKRIVSKNSPNKSSIITEKNVAKKLKEVTSDNAVLLFYYKFVIRLQKRVQYFISLAKKVVRK